MFLDIVQHVNPFKNPISIKIIASKRNPSIYSNIHSLLMSTVVICSTVSKIMSSSFTKYQVWRLGQDTSSFPGTIPMKHLGTEEAVLSGL